MAAGRYAYNEIVAEPLTKKDQEAWFGCVKNFLIARDLWEVVEGTTNLDGNSVSWRRKNAEALQIMQISCTPESSSHIMKVSNAKGAWDILNNIYSDNANSSEPPIPPKEMEKEEIDSTVVSITETEEEEVDSTAACLYRAIRENNWSTVQEIVKDNPSALSAKLTSSGRTALHIAPLFGHVDVEELVKLVSEDHLEIVDSGGWTPLICAIQAGDTRVVKCMVNKNRKTLSIPTSNGNIPVSVASAAGHTKMARYLYSVTPLEDLKSDKGTQGPRLLYYCFNSRNLEAVKANPNLILFLEKRSNRHIFFLAVQYRQAEVFSLIHGLRFKYAIEGYLDASRNSMLHMAGMLAPSSQLSRIPGAALQMQRELQWFKEVESVVPLWIRQSKNKDDKQPEEVFKESHKKLRKEGEEWMKGTASSCSVVGALIITIMFAVAFTVPGGNNQESGYPIFLGKSKLFMVFIISDALSLFSSTTSVLMFLGILTSRYLEEDFLKSLPTKLIKGLSSLFISIATMMMIAFSATLLIMLEHRQSGALLPIIIFASVPVTLFALLQFPLLVQIIYSTYGPSIFRRNVKPWL